MGKKEALSFEKSPLFQDSLDMRTFDEAAKIKNAKVPKLKSYVAMMRRNLELNKKNKT